MLFISHSPLLSMSRWVRLRISIFFFVNSTKIYYWINNFSLHFILICSLCFFFGWRIKVLFFMGVRKCEKFDLFSHEEQKAERSRVKKNPLYHFYFTHDNFILQFFTHAADNLAWEMTQLKQWKIMKFSMREMKYENFFHFILSFLSSLWKAESATKTKNSFKILKILLACRSKSDEVFILFVLYIFKCDKPKSKVSLNHRKFSI